MHALPCQSVEEYGERRDEGLSFTRRHFGDLALVEHHAAEELDVVVDHVPLDVVAAGHPVGGIYGLVAVDGDEILRGGEFAVEVVCRDHDGVVLCKTAGRILHDGECLGEDAVEDLLDLFVDAFGGVVDLLGDLLLLFERGFGLFEFGLQFDDAGLVCGDEVGDLFLEVFAVSAEFVVGEGFDRRVDGLDFLQIGFDQFAVLVGFRTEEGFDDTGNYIHTFCVVFVFSVVNPTKILIFRKIRKK